MAQVTHTRTGNVKGLFFEAVCTGEELKESDINSYHLEYSDIDINLECDLNPYDFFIQSESGYVSVAEYIKNNIFDFDIF